MSRIHNSLQRIVSDLWLLVLVEFCAAASLLMFVIQQDTLIWRIYSVAGWIIVGVIIIRIVYDIIKAGRQTGVAGDNSKTAYIVLAAGEAVYFGGLFVIALLQKPGAYGLYAAILSALGISLLFMLTAYRKNKYRVKA